MGGAYLPAWGVFFLICIIILYILSIPLYILLDDSVVEVHCIVDMTRIHIEDVEKIRVFGKDEFTRLWPLVGSYGFWGYYGYYFDFMEWTTYKVYASDRKHLVLIEDIYEDRFIVSCNDPETFIKHVQEYRDRKRSRKPASHTARRTIGPFGDKSVKHPRGLPQNRYLCPSKSSQASTDIFFNTK